MPENKKTNMPAKLSLRNPDGPRIKINGPGILPDGELKADLSEAFFTCPASADSTAGCNLPWKGNEDELGRILARSAKDADGLPVLLDGEIIYKGGEYVFSAARILIGF